MRYHCTGQEIRMGNSNKVYILLQKVTPELFDITDIIERTETYFGFRNAAVNLAIIFCMGGNDFIPKFHGISHEKWLTVVIEKPTLFRNVVQYKECPDSGKILGGNINQDIYLDIVKKLFCPKNIDPNLMTFEDVRQISIKPPGKDVRPPNAWLPPVCALRALVNLLNCQIDYLFTVWHHDALLPKFLERGCLRIDENGKVQYDFGTESRTENYTLLLTIEEEELKKKMTAHKKVRKREHPGATPEKTRKVKRKPVMSTPV